MTATSGTQALWNEWVKLSLLGTEHQARAPQCDDVPVELQTVVKALYPPEQPVSNSTREADYLALAGVLCSYQSAGFKAVDLEKGDTLPAAPLIEFHKGRASAPLSPRTVLPTRALSGAEGQNKYTETSFTAPSLPPPIMHLFQQIMQLHNPQGLLTGWCQRAINTGLIIPPAHLVEVLEAAQKSEELKVAAGRLLGERGHWLAQFRPVWQRILDDSPLALSATDAADDNTWEDGSLAMRCAYLRTLRSQNATQAREQLQAVWKQENAKARMALLAELETGLSAADEDLLESCLDDRAKGVRALAGELLAHLPESAFVQRHLERLQQWLSVEKTGGLLRRKKLSINVNLPDDWDTGWERDGIHEKAPHAGKGRKAGWLEQALRYVAVAHWSALWEQMPADLLKATGKNDWANNLLAGWEASVRLQGCDAEWALALLEQSKHESGHPAWQYLTAGQAEQLQLANLRAQKKGKTFWSALSELETPLNPQTSTRFAAENHTGWSDSFWAEALGLVEHHLKRHETPTHYTHRYAMDAALENVLGTRLPDSLLERYQALLQSMLKDSKWEDYVSPTTLEIVRLRLQINNQFNKHESSFSSETYNSELSQSALGSPS